MAREKDAAYMAICQLDKCILKFPRDLNGYMALEPVRFDQYLLI